MAVAHARRSSAWACLLLLLSCVSCSGNDVPYGQITAKGPLLVFGPRDPRLTHVDLAAELRAHLLLDEGCARTATTPPRGLIFPEGTRWDDQTNSVILPDGRVLTRRGEFRSGGGGGSFDDFKPRMDASALATMERCRSLGATGVFGMNMLPVPSGP